MYINGPTVTEEGRSKAMDRISEDNRTYYAFYNLNNICNNLSDPFQTNWTGRNPYDFFQSIFFDDAPEPRWCALGPAKEFFRFSGGENMGVRVTLRNSQRSAGQAVVVPGTMMMILGLVMLRTLV